jgi:hypothetical protein
MSITAEYKLTAFIPIKKGYDKAVYTGTIYRMQIGFNGLIKFLKEVRGSKYWGGGGS